MLYWIGTICIVSTMLCQTVSKKYMVPSFVFMIIGSTINLTVGVMTGQGPLIVLNIVATILAIRGLIIWRKK